MAPAKVGPVRLAQFDPRHIELLEPRGERGEQRDRVRILDALRIDVGREADADLVHPDRVADRFENLAREAQPVLD